MAKGESRVGNRENFHYDSHADIRPLTPGEQTPYSQELNPQTKDEYRKLKKGHEKHGRRIQVILEGMDEKAIKVLDYFLDNRDVALTREELSVDLTISQEDVVEIIAVLMKRGLITGGTSYRIDKSDKNVRALMGSKYMGALENLVSALHNAKKN